MSGPIVETHTRFHAAEATAGAGYAYVDGRFCPIAEATMPLMDWGLLRSDATYDVIKITEGRVFHLDDYLARLRRGTELLGMHIAESWESVGQIVAECVARSEMDTCVVYAIVTRGVPPLGMLRDPRLARNRLYVMALPVPWIIPPGDEERALDVWIGLRHRIDPGSVDPTIKNFHWQDFVQSLLHAFDQGADTTILLDLNDNVTEGPGFNVFMVRQGVLLTPSEGVLRGITRQAVIDIAAKLGIPVEERLIPLAELRESNEIFGTSTAGGIVPVGRLDGEPVGDAAPGQITRRLRTHLAQWYRSVEHTEAVADIRARGNLGLETPMRPAPG